MKVLILIGGLFPDSIGGIETMGAEMAAHLARKHEVCVYTGYGKGLPEVEQRDGFTIRRLRSSKDHKPGLVPGVRTFNILRAIREEAKRPDIIISMSLMYGVVGYLARKLFGIPYCVYVLGSNWYTARDRRWKGMAFRFGISKCDVLVTQTTIIRNDVLKYFPRTRIEVIPNGITLPARRADGDKIIYVGRLHKVKGLDYLIEAVRGIENCPQVIIAGPGPEEGKLRQMAEGLNIRFVGEVLEVGDIYTQGRFFVLPSVSEGLPQAILEAMSYGLPVIATKVGGVPEIIEHGKTGFLVEPRDQAELRKYMEMLIRDRDLNSRMSTDCLSEIRKYTWDNIIAKFDRLIGETVAA
jgi:glycosyltransferase involved in cell wall biosynthesis